MTTATISCRPGITITAPAFDRTDFDEHLLSILSPTEGKPLGDIAADFAWAQGWYRNSGGFEMEARRTYRRAWGNLVHALMLRCHGEWGGYKAQATMLGSIYIASPDGSQSFEP